MPSTPNSERILVVDDREVIRELMSSMLTSAGYQCVQASSGYKAESLLSSGEDFELMLSGPAELDEMGGFERLEGFPDFSGYAAGGGDCHAQYCCSSRLCPQGRLRVSAETLRA
jgi:hypothetical protein